MKPFEIIPAIDLSDAKVVRVAQGDLSEMTVYGDDPVEVAQRWEDTGATRLHVVDLDGALAGEPRHRESVARIVAATGIPVQVAGGIRTPEAVGSWLDHGADRVVVGTAAITDAEFLTSVLDAYAERIVVAVDSRDGEVRTSGWTSGSGLQLLPTCLELVRSGVRRLLVTDIARDGMLTGPNVEQLAAVATACEVPLIASGGVSSLADLQALASMRSLGVEAAVVGRALYAGTFRLDDALAAVLD